MKPKAVVAVEESKGEDLAKTTVNHSMATNDLTIMDATDAIIRKTEIEYEGKDNLIIENLQNCTVYIPFKVKALYVKNISNCTIYVGAVSGASFVNKAINSQLHMCSHQIRIHNSENTHFHLIAKSNPIIEHC